MAATARRRAASKHDQHDEPGDPWAFLRETIWRAAARPAKAAYLRQCEALQARAADPRHYLAVVGEPGSGKRTLIEALERAGANAPRVLVDTDFAADAAPATRHVMSEVADAILVAVPAHDPMSPALVQFLRDAAEPFLHRCVFVVTAIDQVAERDREDLIGQVRAEIWKHLGLRHPLVLEACALALQPAASPDPLAVTRAGWQARFRELDTALADAMVRYRRHLLAERTVGLLRAILLGLRGQLTRLELPPDERVRSEHAVLAIEDELARLLHEGAARLPRLDDKRRPRATTRSPRSRPQG